MNKTASIQETSVQGIACDQPCRQQNIDAITSYYLSGVKHGAGRIGIELEHLLLHRADGTPVAYSEDHGVRWLLEQLQADYPETVYDGDHDLIGVSRSTVDTLEAVTLEPAAQLELSAGPFVSLLEARACFQAFENRVESILDPVGKEIMLLGYQPNAKAAETELIPKRRYKFMDMYLGEKGRYGRCMMRGTASTQVSVDFTSEDDCLRKLRLTGRMVPLLALITDNTPIFEGGRRPHELMRTEVWKYCDPDRCGLVPGMLDEGFGLEKYAQYVLDTPAILIPCKKSDWCYDEKTFGEIYARTPMQRQDVEHAVSMLFNDIRLKTYIEIRPADALPVDFAIAYAAFIKGLFANETSLSAAEELLGSEWGEADVAQAKEDLMSRGYDAIVYGRPVGDIAQGMCDIALEGLPAEERELLAPIAMLIDNRTTLAEISIKG
jgi:glutamate--cysteine ligase